MRRDHFISGHTRPNAPAGSQVLRRSSFPRLTKNSPSQRRYVRPEPAFSVGMGRAGAIIAPLVAGLLIGNGWSREAYRIVLAVPALVGAVAVFWIGSFDGPQPMTRDEALLKQPLKV